MLLRLVFLHYSEAVSPSLLRSEKQIFIVSSDDKLVIFYYWHHGKRFVVEIHKHIQHIHVLCGPMV